MDALAQAREAAAPNGKVAGGGWAVHYGGMAFRIHDSVVRGEVDNRAKGIVRGKIWVEGRAEPVVLELRATPAPIWRAAG